jgi:FSR family fosmidomycin resistance protein-like MFS transporter
VLAGIDRKAMAAISSGHLATDLSQGALPALLPYLKTEFDLSYTMAAALVLASTVASSIIQPLFGFWSDVRGALWLLPAGVVLAGVGMGLATVAPTYPLVALAVMLSGVGVAAFHPEGSKLASFVSGAKRASGMSFFSIGGNLGFALGPLAASGLILAFGLRGGLLLMVPGALVAAALVALMPYLAGFVPTSHAAGRRSDRPSQSKGMALLLAVVGFRSLAHMGLFAFVPLWEVHKGASETHGTLLLSLFLLSGAVGTIFGGPLADRFGLKPVLLLSFTASIPLILVYVLVGGVAGAVTLAFAGAVVIGTFGLTIVMGQEYMPGRVAMASGLSIGLAIGLGGVAATTLGAIADAIDLRTALLLTVVGPALCLVLTFLLPPVRRGRLPEPAAAPV